MKNTKNIKWGFAWLMSCSMIFGIAANNSHQKKHANVFQRTFAEVKDSIPPALALSPIVNFDDYLELAEQVKKYRENRLISIETFNEWSQQPNVIILDTRSDSLYNHKHLAGAIHLNFSDFTQGALNALIPNADTKILIYCNNNFKAEILETKFRIEPEYFVSKSSTAPVRLRMDTSVQSKLSTQLYKKPPTLALNIPTFINLVGYGFTNVYELGEQLFVNDPRLKFEGSDAGE